MKFQDLSKKSTATMVKYFAGKLSCLFHDRSGDLRYRITIQTPLLRSCFFSSVAGELVSTANCFFESLDTMLMVDSNGRYTVSSSKNATKAALDGSIVAVGLSAEEYPYLASIRMFDAGVCLFAVPVKSENDISLEVISESEWNLEKKLGLKIAGRC